ncbi:MAG: amidohydrolase family protein [Planctomycetota bacterium]
MIDAHCHVMGPGEHASGAVVMKQGDAAGQLRISRHCGVDLTAMMSWQGPVAGDVAAGNVLMERLVEEHPQAILGLSSIDPLQQSVQEMLAAIRPLHESHCFPGIKPYFPRNAVHYHAEVYDPVWAYANGHALYVLLHTDESEQAVAGVERLAVQYPEVSFIFAHSGGNWTYAERCAGAARKGDNIYCELTLTPVHNGIVEFLVEQAGQDRVLFGTDAPMRDPRPQLGWVVHSRLSTEAKRDVLGRNFLRVLKRCKAPGMAVFAPRLEQLCQLADQPLLLPAGEDHVQR